MANTLRVKRRTSGATGAPSSLAAGEIAYNNMDGILYIGFGDNGSGVATSVKAFAKDNFVDPSGVYQPLDSDLTAIAALAANGIIARTATGTAAVRTITGTAGRTAITNGDGVSGNPTIDLATVTVGSTTTGGSTKFTVDAYGRITNASQASLSDLSAPTAAFGMGGFKLTNVADPTVSSDAATKNYVDSVAQGLSWKQPVLVATTANITLSGEQTIDGITTSASRVLVKNQATAANNGIYVSGAGAWTRATDMDAWAEVPSAAVLIMEGTTYADQQWVCSSDPGGTLGSTAITFAQISGAGGGTTNNALTFNSAGSGAASGASFNGSSAITISYNSVGAQPLNTQLTNFAATAWSAGVQVPTLTAANTFALKTVGAATGNLLDKASGDSLYAPISGSANYQAANTRLSNLAGLTISTADNIVLYGATNAAAAYQLGSTGKTLMAATSAASAQSTLGLGSMATQAASAVAITGGTIDGVTLDGGTF